MKAADLDAWGLYVHIPFCQARCTYCDFNTITGMGNEDYHLYAQAVVKEWQTVDQPKGPLASVFFGGGTPSLMDPEDIAQILTAVRRQLIGNWPENAPEITMEANPGTTTIARLTAYRSAGVNRLSLGAQALQDSHLQRLGRIHSAQDIAQAVKDARTAGFDNVSLDAIYGLPDQTLTEWQETVQG
ncbi:MAG: coproporphyrinogen-III oxidase family protein, partial [Firmicutes bacterium]|nr:coproporphyrinogen-III oxidase family protein [Bacillota bacterium]